MNGSLPRAEIWLQAAEAHRGNLQARWPGVITRRSEGSRWQQWGTQRGTKRGAQTSAQPANGGHLGERGAFSLWPWSLLILLNGGKLLHDPSVALAVILKNENNVSYYYYLSHNGSEVYNTLKLFVPNNIYSNTLSFLRYLELLYFRQPQ